MSGAWRGEFLLVHDWLLSASSLAVFDPERFIYVPIPLIALIRKSDQKSL
jgi:hypothetical protein